MVPAASNRSSAARVSAAPWPLAAAMSRGPGGDTPQRRKRVARSAAMASGAVRIAAVEGAQQALLELGDGGRVQEQRLAAGAGRDRDQVAGGDGGGDDRGQRRRGEAGAVGEAVRGGTGRAGGEDVEGDPIG